MVFLSEYRVERVAAIKKRLAIITLSTGFGGGEKWCSRLADEAETARFEPIIIPFVIDCHFDMGAQVARWRGWSRNTLFNLVHLQEIIRSFEQIFRDINPSVVVCATWPAAMLCLYLKSRHRFPWKLLIVFHRQTQEVFFRSSWLNLLVPLKIYFFHRYLKLADKVVVLNESSRYVLWKWAGIHPDVIPNGVDIESIRVQSMEESSIQVPFPYIAFLGRFEREKGLETLVRAFLLMRDCSVNLALVGDGLLEPRLRRLVFELGLVERVFFLGFRDNPFPILNDAVALIVPSPWECQPLVVLEAFALSVPVVGVDNPGMRDLLGDGSRGLLCAEDPVSIASALREVLNGGSEVESRIAAGEKYVEKHDEAMMLAHYFTILENIS